jgi:hypothetical protein
MKATLEFNLPDEQSEFESAVNGHLYKHVVWDIDNYLRSKLKYSDLTDTEYTIYDDIRTVLWEFINAEKLNFD